MPDHIRYDLLTQQALRGVVRSVLSEAAQKGLPGDHHFYISYNTRAEGVRMSDRLRAQYPEQITIILQHQFWDLAVTEHGFEVGLSFGGVPEKLVVPFEAITGFFDPSVQFGLQFEEVAEDEDHAAPADAPARPTGEPAGAKRPSPALVQPEPTVVPLAAAEPPAKPEPPEKPTGGGDVVRLDRFRKK